MTKRRKKKEKKQVFLLTDGCMWEKNKVEGTNRAHAIEVVNIKTGQVRYIKSGARIQIIDGEVSESRSQESYNKQKS